MIEAIELHLNCEQPSNLKELCSQQNELDYEHILKCMDNGAVWLTVKAKTKRVFNPDIIIDPTQTLHIYCNEFTLKECPFEALLVEDLGDFSVWYKPSGMLSQGSKYGTHWSIHRWIEQHVFKDRECFITHRLDRFTQGLMLVAHTKEANSKLHRLFESRAIQKTYRAVVKGLFPVDECVEINSQINKQDAQSTVTGLAQDTKNKQSLLSITPKTGRKHQVRRHLSYIGHSVVNDRQYGETPYTGDLMLQAAELEFKHPETQADLHFSIPSDTLIKLENS